MTSAAGRRLGCSIGVSGRAGYPSDSRITASRSSGNPSSARASACSPTDEWQLPIPRSTAASIMLIDACPRSKAKVSRASGSVDAGASSAIAAAAPRMCAPHRQRSAIRSSVARSVTRMKSHGCVFVDDGERRPASAIRSRSAGSIGRSRYSRVFRRDRSASQVSTPPSVERLLRGVVILAPIGGIMAQGSRPHAPTAERRWPMAVAVLTAVFLQLTAPEGGRIAPRWLFPLIELALLAVLMIRDPGRIDARGKGSRRATIALISVMTIATLAGVAVLIVDILDTNIHSVNANALLGRGASLWVTNVITFSFWFWIFDRGGPGERAARSGVAPSFAFPENATPELAPEDWMPRYHDYLYLSFTNATAFSPTDTLPVRAWAKMAMMAESVISLLTAIM